MLTRYHAAWYRDIVQAEQERAAEAARAVRVVNEAVMAGMVRVATPPHRSPLAQMVLLGRFIDDLQAGHIGPRRFESREEGGLSIEDMATHLPRRRRDRPCGGQDCYAALDSSIRALYETDIIRRALLDKKIATSEVKITLPLSVGSAIPTKK